MADRRPPLFGDRDQKVTWQTPHVVTTVELPEHGEWTEFTMKVKPGCHLELLGEDDKGYHIRAVVRVIEGGRG